VILKYIVLQYLKQKELKGADQFRARKNLWYANIWSKRRRR